VGYPARPVLRRLAAVQRHPARPATQPLTWGGYLTSTNFAVDVAENWQSEFLNFWLYFTATVWLVQKGSTGSKALGKAGLESDKDQRVSYAANKDSPRLGHVRGWRTANPIYSSSLAIVMGTIFLLSWLVQSVTGWAVFNETRLQQLQDPLSWGTYLTKRRLLDPGPCRTVRASSSQSAPWRYSRPTCARGILAEQTARRTPRRHRNRRLTTRCVPGPRGYARAEGSNHAPRESGEEQP
jgi:hypothetical protein